MQNILPKVKGKYRFNINLSKFCWLNTGGNALLMFIPYNTYDLQKFLQEIDIKMPIFVLGNGSNVLIRDKGFDGIIIKLGNNFNYLKQLNDDTIEVGGATSDYNTSIFARDNLIGGFEFLYTIPGTIGGGIAMNGGAYNRDFSNIITQVSLMDLQGNIIVLKNDEFGFKYRGNNLNKQYIFLSAQLKGYKANQHDIANNMTTIQTQRHKSQPVKGVKTCGSIFKNPLHVKAWQLIDAAGCRGLTIGNAQISTLHCNFLINNGNATAYDIELLINTVKNKVFNHSNILLEEELIFLGNK